MPSERFVFGFVANDESPYVITRYYDEDNSDMMVVDGSYNQDNTFTLQYYYGRAPLTDLDFETLDGKGGYTFPITDAEWNALIPLINNARGSKIPRIDVDADE